MELNETLAAELLEALAELDRNCRSLAPEEKPSPPPTAEVPETAAANDGPEPPPVDYASAAKSLLADYRETLSGLLASDMERLEDAFDRLQRCKAQLALVEEAERSISDPERCAMYAAKARPEVTVTLDALLAGQSNLVSLAYRANRALHSGWIWERREACGAFTETAARAKELLKTEIRRLRVGIDRSARELQTRSGAASACGVTGASDSRTVSGAVSSCRSCMVPPAMGDADSEVSSKMARFISVAAPRYARPSTKVSREI